MSTNGSAATYDGQILFVRTTRCLNCGAIHTTSELFYCDPLARGEGRKMGPASSYASNIALQKVAPATRTTPICHACCDQLQPTITDRESYARWQDTLRRKREQDRAEAERTKPKQKPVYTLDDLV